MGGDPGGGETCSTGLFMKEGSLPDSDIFESGQLSFPNLSSLQKLLVHIGVVHDKINTILKMKGIEELPSYQISTQNTKPQDVKNEPSINQHPN